MRIRLVILLPLLLVLFGITHAGTYSGGNGASVGTAYQIANLDDLSELCQTSGDWGAYFKQTAPIDASATQYWDDAEESSNSDLYDDPNDGTAAGNNEGFSPIGNVSLFFTGSYDGQGYTISGLTIDRSGTNYIGLFGYTGGGATISNVGLVDGSVTGSGWYAGGLVGMNGGATVQTSYATGSVSGSSYVGGLVGTNNWSTSITNAYATGSVTGNSEVGGLVGSNYYSSSISSSRPIVPRCLLHIMRRT